MMQSAESWQGQDSAGPPLVRIFSASGERFLFQSEVRPVIVVIANVLGHESFHMEFVQNNHMIE